MKYAVVVVGGQGFEAPDAHQARSLCAMKNGCSSEHVGAFANSGTVYVVPKSARDDFRATVESETGEKSQVCTFDRTGNLKVWGGSHH